jgi:branched-chain amino acid transport system ATP-binding protein
VTALLEAAGLSVAYGGLRAVDEVDLTIESSRVVGLIGPNGAGKTTFIDAITGFVPTAGGAVTFDGHALDRLPPYRRARLGLARTWQSLELFDDLNVRENLQVAAERARWWSFLADAVRPNRAQNKTAVDDALDTLGLTDLADRMPDELSQGQRKLVGVARALAARPSLLCMDEPAAGLDTRESAEFGRRVRDLLDHGITVFLIDHDMGLVLSVCDVIYVLEFGRVIAVGTPHEIRNDDRVIAAYLGEEARKTKEATSRPISAGDAP